MNEVKKTRKVKEGEPKWDITREYVFELLADYSEYQPKEKVGGSPLANGKPPVYTVPSEGMAFNKESGKVEKWRLITGQPSIWVSEQEGLEKATPREINDMLAQPQNELTFIKGFLRVRGVDELKLEALTSMDEFEENDAQYLPKNRVFRLLNPDRELDKRKIDQDSEYYALKKAKESSDEQMLSFALALGLDINDQTEKGMKKIRSEFYDKAKANPIYFNKMFDLPKNKIKFVVHQALKKGIISFSQQKNQLTFVEGNVPIMTINPNEPLDAEAQFCDKIFKKDKEMIAHYKAFQIALGMDSE